MINHRVQKYVEDHSFCSEYLFRDWEAFLDFIYEEGCRVSSILWWDHCKKMSSMNPAEAVDTPILTNRNGCMLRPGFMKMDLKKNPLRT